MKEVPYFSHDYNARNDLKIIPLLKEMGYEGLGLYWCIVEILYESGGYAPINSLSDIAYSLRTDEEKISPIIYNFGLFQYDGENFWSNSALERLEMRAEKSTKAKELSNKRWNKKDNNADRNADRNAINKVNKESKVNKVKEIKKEGEAYAPALSVKNDELENDFSTFPDYKQIKKMFIRTLGRNPRQPEYEEVSGQVKIHGLQKVEKLFHDAVLRNFKSVGSIFANADEYLNLKPYGWDKSTPPPGQVEHRKPLINPDIQRRYDILQKTGLTSLSEYHGEI